MKSLGTRPWVMKPSWKWASCVSCTPSEATRVSQVSWLFLNVRPIKLKKTEQWLVAQCWNKISYSCKYPVQVYLLLWDQDSPTLELRRQVNWGPLRRAGEWGPSEESRGTGPSEESRGTGALCSNRPQSRLAFPQARYTYYLDSVCMGASKNKLTPISPWRSTYFVFSLL